MAVAALCVFLPAAGRAGESAPTKHRLEALYSAGAFDANVDTRYRVVKGAGTHGLVIGYRRVVLPWFDLALTAQADWLMSSPAGLLTSAVVGAHFHPSEIAGPFVLFGVGVLRVDTHDSTRLERQYWSLQPALRVVAGWTLVPVKGVAFVLQVALLGAGPGGGAIGTPLFAGAIQGQTGMVFDL